MAERAPRTAVICSCGHDGKLMSPDCPLHGERGLSAQTAALRAQVARLEGQKEAMAAALRMWVGGYSLNEMKGFICGDACGHESCKRWRLTRAALSPDAGTKECEKCRGTGARHVAGEPTQEPCGECSGEGVVSDAGAGWVSPEVGEQAEKALRWCKANHLGIALTCAALDALKGVK